MHRVSNTTQIFTSIAIASLISSCGAKIPPTPTTQNISTDEEIAASSIASVSTPTPIPSTQLTPIPSPAPATISLVSNGNTDRAAAVVPVPPVTPLSVVSDERVEPLDNIAANPQLAKQPQSKRRARNSIISSTPCRAFPCLVLSQDPNNSQNQFNNPIYKLTAYKDNSANYAFQLDAVTGRAFTQERNRYRSNTEAPLPDGSYSVIPRVVKGTIPEVGGTMLPIFPKRGFDARMRRTALGIHWDPSFDRDKSEDGTSGCIGLTNKNDYHRVRNFVLKYRPRSLEVQIDR